MKESQTCKIDAVRLSEIAFGKQELGRIFGFNKHLVVHLLYYVKCDFIQALT